MQRHASDKQAVSGTTTSSTTVYEHSEDTVPSPSRLAAYSTMADVKDQSTIPDSPTKSLPAAIDTRTNVSNQHHMSKGATDQEATKGFFDNPSNVASTLGAISALALASVIVCALVLHFTDSGGHAKK